MRRDKKDRRKNIKQGTQKKVITFDDITKGAKKGAGIPVSKGGLFLKIAVPVFILFVLCGIWQVFSWISYLIF